MTAEKFYGSYYPALLKAEQLLNHLPLQYTLEKDDRTRIKPIAYHSTRIKTPESLLGKAKRHNMPFQLDAAMSRFYDIVGLRIVCSFVDDVYLVAEWLKGRPELTVLRVKDYIAYPKPNGYRSLHLLVQLREEEGTINAEIQLRTIAIDFWATLEHQLKYKQNVPHEALIRSELKRCADEIAATDLSMQTIRDLISEGF